MVLRRVKVYRLPISFRPVQALECVCLARRHNPSEDGAVTVILQSPAPYPGLQIVFFLICHQSSNGMAADTPD